MDVTCVLIIVHIFTQKGVQVGEHEATPAEGTQTQCYTVEGFEFYLLEMGWANIFIGSE